MIFHLGFELPQPVSKNLDHESPTFTQEEIRILKNQVRQNTVLVSEYVAKIDLFVNKERYPRKAIFVAKLRRRLELLMEENDNFRKSLWKHYQQLDSRTNPVRQ